MNKILVVEDDENLKKEIVLFLNENGYHAKFMPNYEDPIEYIIKYDADIVLLDYKLPNKNGGFILKELRKQTNVPIIIMTGLNDDMNEIICIHNGADDYITKPFNLNVLLVRIEKTLNQINKTTSILKYKDIMIDSDKSIMTKANKRIDLSKNEKLVLVFLIKNQGHIVSREEIMEYLWGTKEYIDDNTLTANVSRVKNKLKEFGYDDVIETKRGQGYIIE